MGNVASGVYDRYRVMKPSQQAKSKTTHVDETTLGQAVSAEASNANTKRIATTYNIAK